MSSGKRMVIIMRHSWSRPIRVNFTNSAMQLGDRTTRLAAPQLLTRNVTTTRLNQALGAYRQGRSRLRLRINFFRASF